MSREAVLTLLEGAARHLDSLADARGARVCPEHGVEHLGKSAYRVHLGLALHAAGRGDHREAVKRTALRLAATCRKYPHPEARAFLFFERWPDPWNCSNHLIDSGAICDALGRVLLEAPDLLSNAERDAVAGALERSASTYLWAASLDKPVPAQCLWGALGMARASVALGKPELADRARAALLRAYDDLADDGSWSYYRAGGEPGSEDASAFYHSRCIGFALEVLALVGDAPTDEPHRTNLTAALELLLALHRADGRKCRAWEAKLWYFDDDAETASLSFDVHALLLGERAFAASSGGRYAARAARSLALLADSQAPDGSIGCGRTAPGGAFQCRTFWTAHVGLLGSVLADLPGTASPAVPEPARPYFPDAGLARLVHGERVVLVRGRRPRPSPGFGGLAGGGARVADGMPAGERVARRAAHAGRARVPGELVAPAAFPRFPLRAHGLAWLRFSTWRWRCELRARGLGAAARRMLGTIGEVARWWSRDAASQFALDVELAVGADGEVVARGSLAAVDGSPLAGTRTTRRYRLDAAGLRIHETLESDVPRLVLFAWPEGATDLAVDGRPAPPSTALRRHDVTRLELSYRLP